MEIIILILLITLVALVGFTILRKPAAPTQDNALLLQAIQTVKDGTNQAIIQAMQSSSENVTRTMDSVLRAVGDSQKSVTDSTTQVGQRLDAAGKVIGEVQSRLGELGAATKEIKELGLSVSSLQQMLQAPKLRGGFGEVLLEDMMKQILPQANFEMQHRFKSGLTVDAYLQTAGGGVSIDSKFPFENYRKFVQATSPTDKKLAARTFIGDVKKHIDAIATKYILPDEGTLPFALMYVPVESVYYEIVVRDDEDAIDNQDELFKYALSHYVVPVSPSSFFSYLVTIAFGLKGLVIEKNAREIINKIARLGDDFERLQGTWSTFRNHSKNAQAKEEECSQHIQALHEKVRSIGETVTA